MSIKKITEKVISIPSDNLDMEVFINENKENLMNHILDRICYAVDNNMDCVELFSFEKTKYYVLLYNKDYAMTLEHVFSYFIENEMYESCQKAKNIKDKMISFVRNVKTTYN